MTSEESIKRKMSDAMDAHDFETAQEVLALDKHLIQAMEKVEECIRILVSQLGMSNTNRNPSEIGNRSASDGSPAINYEQYNVDREEKHFLSESFTHKKICAFKLEGKNTW